MTYDDSGGERIVEEKHKSIEKEMKESYMDYSMSVIVGRALPDVRDGLKPVHRRILYAMNEMGLSHTRSHKKSARVVGEVLGKYHPHGDTAVYDSLVRMAQDFSLRYPLVDGQGNFGSVDGDRAAAMRYTETRLSRIADEVLRDIDRETVDFTDNFDASLKEPCVLPSVLPNLLVNGSSGIAVGMATNMPPHNLTEVLDAVVAVIEDHTLESMDLLQYVKAPDFPTGGIVYGMAGVMSAYTTGRGAVKVRAKTHYEEEKKSGKGRIIVTEIPYMVNKSNLLETIANLVKDKKIEGITDLRDESDRRGMRIVIELKRDAMEDVVLNQLFVHTQMQSTFGIINLALVNGRPKQLTLREMVGHFIKHREDMVRRRTEYDLRKAEDRLHILEGLLTALDNLDDIISIIRKAENAEDAIAKMTNKYLLSVVQSKAILDMRLQKLTGMERQSVKDEHVQVNEKIRGLKNILESNENILAVVKKECLELKDKYGDERRTAIEENAEELDIEDLIPVEDVVITITNTGYIKRIPVQTYRTQGRGGVGLIGMETKEEDYVVDAFVTSTHDYILFFTNIGRMYWLKAYKVPLGGRHSKGKPVINLLPRLQPNEKMQAAIHVKDFDPEHFLVFCTEKGKIKKTALPDYSHVRITGVRALNLNEGDELVNVEMSDGDKEIVIATHKGMAVRFHEGEVRSMGRVAAGVRGIRLREGDKVVAMTVVDNTDVLLTLTETGYGKRTPVDQYRKIHRGGYGVITIKTGGRNGNVVNVMKVEDGDQLLISTKEGMVIRIPVDSIRIISRNTMGVRIMRLKKEGDVVTAVARTAASEDDDTGEGAVVGEEESTVEDDDLPDERVDGSGE